ncbi:MAG: hypothetical protein ACRBFS_16185 [Aureispira sp.]
MQYPSFLIKSILIVLYCCCCSFSAVPAKQAPPQKKLSVKEKRQIRQQKRQQRRLYRAHKQQQQRQHFPKKNHATFNILGFILVLGSMIFFLLSMMVALITFGIFGSAIIIAFSIILSLSSIILITGIVFCIMGLSKAKETAHPKIGFGIAGLVIITVVALIFLMIMVSNFIFLLLNS